MRVVRCPWRSLGVQSGPLRPEGRAGLVTHMIELLIVPVGVVVVQPHGYPVVFSHEHRVQHRQHLWTWGSYGTGGVMKDKDALWKTQERRRKKTVTKQ